MTAKSDQVEEVRVLVLMADGTVHACRVEGGDKTTMTLSIASYVKDSPSELLRSDLQFRFLDVSRYRFAEVSGDDAWCLRRFLDLKDTQ